MKRVAQADRVAGGPMLAAVEAADALLKGPAMGAAPQEAVVRPALQLKNDLPEPLDLTSRTFLTM